MSVAEVPLKREIQVYKKKLSGVIDLQIHLAPDIVQRSSSEDLFGKKAADAGYFGWLSKCHHLTTAGRQLLLDHGNNSTIHFFGSVALNNSMGGLNPYAVEVALKLGACQVWMPTLDAENHIRTFGQATLPTFKQLETSKSRGKALPAKPLSVLTESGTLKDEAKDVIEAMEGSEAILGTGHLALNESFKVIEYAKRRGIKNILITHPEFKATYFSKEDQKKLAEEGAFIEHCGTVNYDPKLIADNINFVGVSHCVISSDSGQPQKGHPIDAFYDLIVALEGEGISSSEIQTMTIDNPKKLLGF